MYKALSDYLQVDEDLAVRLSEPLKEIKVECDLRLSASNLPTADDTEVLDVNSSADELSSTWELDDEIKAQKVL